MSLAVSGAVRAVAHRLLMTQRTDPGPSTTTSASLGTRLQAEWDRLAHRRSLVARANGWHLLPVRMDTLDELVVASGYARRGDQPALAQAAGERANAVLGELLIRATTDELAARVVLQRLLPGLAVLARRHRHCPEMAFDELVGVAWSVIRRFNHTRRRPRFIAATLLRDCQYEAYGRAIRRRMVSVPTAPTALDDVASAAGNGEAVEELLDLVADAKRAGVVSADDLAVVAGALRGETPSSVAKQLSVSERTLRVRRAALVQRLRDVALAAAAA